MILTGPLGRTVELSSINKVELCISFLLFMFLVQLRTLQEENKFLHQKVQTLESELKW